MSEPKTVTVIYLSALREKSGHLMEVLITESATVSALYKELEARYQFQIPLKWIRVAVNGELKGWSSLIHPEDIVVFITPLEENSQPA